MIQKCRPRDILDCCYVTEDNIDAFLEMVEPGIRIHAISIKRHQNFYIVKFEKRKDIYRLNSWYVYDWINEKYIYTPDFGKYFEIVDNETRV